MKRPPKPADVESRRKVACEPADLPGFSYERDLGNPGEAPFTRGIHREMYRKRLWTMRQYAGYGTAEEANRRFLDLLEKGNRGLSVAFDLPTQIGLDSDHPLARGEVGRVGVAIDALPDMAALFSGIQLDAVSTSMTINATAGMLLALYLVCARSRGCVWRELRGTVQNDILKEYMARGTYIYPPGPSLRLVGDILVFCLRELPLWYPISVSGYHIREAGATAAQEGAFTLANAEVYLELVLSRGVEVDDIAPRFSFFFSAANDFFEEIAKFRALRRCWARLTRERFGARNPDSQKLRFHVQTAGSTLTAQQPENNLVRVALQAFAAVIGGAQSLHTNSWDEALSLPSRQAAELALRTQQVLAWETGAADVIDPLGGSWYVERRTNDLEEEMEEYLTRIRVLGGVLTALESGFFDREIEAAAYSHQQSLESGDRKTVGVNSLCEGESPSVSSGFAQLPGDPQLARLEAFRSSRNQALVREKLGRIREAAAGDANLMPSIIEGLEALATVGEVSDTLREVFGEFRSSRA